MCNRVGLRFVTTGDIARELGRPLRTVTYANQRLGILEDSRAGTYRLFHRDRLPELVDLIESVGSSEDHRRSQGRSAR